MKLLLRNQAESLVAVAKLIAHNTFQLTVSVFLICIVVPAVLAEDAVERVFSEQPEKLTSENYLRTELVEIHLANADAVESFDLCVRTKIIKTDAEGRELVSTHVKRVMHDDATNLDVIFYRMTPFPTVKDGEVDRNVTKRSWQYSYVFSDGKKLIHHLPDGNKTIRERKPDTQNLAGDAGVMTYWGMTGLIGEGLGSQFSTKKLNRLLEAYRTPSSNTVGRMDIYGNATIGPRLEPEALGMPHGAWGTSNFDGVLQVFNSYTAHQWFRTTGKTTPYMEVESEWNEYNGIKVPVLETVQRQNKQKISVAKWIRINSGIEGRFSKEIRPTTNDFDEILSFDSLVDISQPAD